MPGGASRPAGAPLELSGAAPPDEALLAQVYTESMLRVCAFVYWLFIASGAFVAIAGLVMIITGGADTMPLIRMGRDPSSIAHRMPPEAPR